MWISTHLGAMTDGSKRLRDQDDFPSSKHESLFGKRSGRASEGFELIRDVPESSAQQPVIPKNQPPTKLQLPEGVGSVEKWGATICALPKVKEEAPTYHEIGALSKFKEYRNGVVHQGASKGPRCIDLRNYLIVSGAVDAENGV
jgi:hypothetical protein